MILVVEDEIICQKIITHSLKNLNMEIDYAQDGYLAKQKIQQNIYDLAVIDLVLPGPINGTDLVQKLKQRNTGTKIIVCSGYGASVHTKMEKLGVDAFLTKPVKPEELNNLVRKLLNIPAEIKTNSESTPVNKPKTFPEKQIFTKTTPKMDFVFYPDILHNFPQIVLNRVISLGTIVSLEPEMNYNVNFSEFITILVSGQINCSFNNQILGELKPGESIGHESLMKNIDPEKKINMTALEKSTLLIVPKIEFLKYFCTLSNELLSILEKNIVKSLAYNPIIKAGSKITTSGTKPLPGADKSRNIDLESIELLKI